MIRQQYRCIFMITNVSHIGKMFLLWCDEDWGYFFDDPIVKEGIAVSPDGNFSNLENFPESYLKP
jgi:hypothetical protein